MLDPKAIERDRSAGERLFQELSTHPVDRWALLCLNRRTFHNIFLCKAILDKAKELGFSDASAGLEMAEVALALADRLPAERYGEALISDLKGHGWCSMGNLRTRSSDLAGAEEALERSREFLAEGTGDPMELARLERVRGTYLLYRRDFQAGIRAYDKAIRIYDSIGAGHEAGGSRLDKGTLLSAMGDQQAAVEITELGLETVDEELEPRVALAGRHNLSVFQQRLGNLDRAVDILKEIAPLYRDQKDALVMLRLRWLEGHLAQARGDLPQAERTYLEVRDGFVAKDVPYEAGAVSFDLATILAEEGRVEELQALAADLVRIFTALRVGRETIAALELFQSTIAATGVTKAWITELARYFRRWEGSSEPPPFRPPD